MALGQHSQNNNTGFFVAPKQANMQMEPNVRINKFIIY